MEEIGPVDYAVIAFPGNQFKGEIAPALADLTDDGTIRIIDVAFVGKSAGGDTVAMELTELDPQVQASLDKLGGTTSQVAGADVTTVRAGAFSVSAAAFDGKLVLSTAPAGIAAARQRTASLADDDAFRSVAGPIEGRLSSLVFLDFDQLLTLGEQTGLNDSSAYRAVRQDLKQVRAVGARSSGSGGDTTAEIRIRLR